MNSQRQFVIVCGNINYDSVDGFLKDFFHPARDDSNCEVVFLNKTEPDLMFEGLLKRERTRVTYFKVILEMPSFKYKIFIRVQCLTLLTFKECLQKKPQQSLCYATSFVKTQVSLKKCTFSIPTCIELTCYWHLPVETIRGNMSCLFLKL